jgi:single-strand DNA-binding protein
MSHHLITLTGNVGRIEMKYLNNGTAITNMNVATNRSYTPKGGERVTETTWFRVAVFGKQAEVCNQYLKKGSRVQVIGRMNPDKESGAPRTWIREDGTAGSSYEVTAENVVFLGGDSDKSPKPAVQKQETEDIPF